LFNGQGRLETTDGTVYEGEFKDGFKHGKGMLVTVVEEVLGQYMLHKHEDVYEGEFKENKFHGNGRMVYHDGLVYQ